MVALSGLFFPIDGLPAAMRVLARAQPLTYAVSLLDGIWRGEGWSAHLGDVMALVLSFSSSPRLPAACSAGSSVTAPLP